MNLFAYVYCHKILLTQFSPGFLEHRQLSYRIHDDEHRLKSIENDARSNFAEWKEKENKGKQ